MGRKEEVKKCIEILEKIDRLLDQLEKHDPYGDTVQNFEDIMRERHTKRLIYAMKKELAGESPYKYF